MGDLTIAERFLLVFFGVSNMIHWLEKLCYASHNGFGLVAGGAECSRRRARTGQGEVAEAGPAAGHRVPGGMGVRSGAGFCPRVGRSRGTGGGFGDTEGIDGRRRRRRTI